MINSNDRIQDHIMKMVAGSRNHRIRPRELEKTLSVEEEVPVSTIKKALRELIQKGKLVFTYRDPCSFVEIPAGETTTVRDL
jgi:hypothetical protein